MLDVALSFFISQYHFSSPITIWACCVYHLFLDVFLFWYYNGDVVNVIVHIYYVFLIHKWKFIKSLKNAKAREKNKSLKFIFRVKLFFLTIHKRKWIWNSLNASYSLWHLCAFSTFIEIQYSGTCWQRSFDLKILSRFYFIFLHHHGVLWFLFYSQKLAVIFFLA